MALVCEMIFAYLAAPMARLYLRFLLLIAVLLVDGFDQLQGSANDNWADYNASELLRKAICDSGEIEFHAGASIDLNGDGYHHNIDLAEISEEQIGHGLSVVRKKSPASDHAGSIHCWQVRSFLASYRQHILRRSKDFCHIAWRRHLFLRVLRN